MRRIGKVAVMKHESDNSEAHKKKKKSQKLHNKKTAQKWNFAF
jgi:hypothetical protein